MQNRKHELRFSLVVLFLILCFCFFIINLVLIQVFKSDHLAKLANKQHNQLIELEPVRGTIYDRNLRPLALNVSVHSLYANPKEMSKEGKKKALEVLPHLLGMDKAEIASRLNKDKYFVWLKRKLPMELADVIKTHHIKGLSFIDESKRHYPNGQLAAHVIGFAGIDNNGLEGSELVFDRYLKGKPGKALFIRDAKQRGLMLEKNFIAPQNGLDVVLTIDETIQYIAERALEKAMTQYKAKSATIIVANPKTGEILALANRPTYNLEMTGKSTIESRTNRAVSFVLEPGSVFKIVAASAALEEGTYTESDIIFCENGEYRVGNHTLHDHHPLGKLTFQQVIEQSSNIGVTKIAQKMGADTFYNYAHRFRFGMLTNIELRGEVDGWLKKPSEWSKTTIGAIPIGHEVTVTPLQLIGAISAVANDGYYMRPHILKYIKDQQNQYIKTVQPEIVDRVISESTAHRLREILIGVTENGTAKKAKIDGIRVAGKTGTPQKIVDGKYSHNKFIATFYAYAPADDPKLSIVVIVDEPRPSYYGGTVSAPVAKEVLENSLKYLQSVEYSNSLAYDDPKKSTR
ncbi:MAG: penicillin-binding protein 2 [Candidatus Omnitrophica bacterium]|nr:penicillin-binding protein 2 [Candidatus Omnitrophota bacterium]